MSEGGLLEVYRDLRGLRVLSFDGDAAEAVSYAGRLATGAERDVETMVTPRRRGRFRLQRRTAVIVVVTTQA